jgi:hypothetical protein
VKKTLANSEPSTHDPKRTLPSGNPTFQPAGLIRYDAASHWESFITLIAS